MPRTKLKRTQPKPAEKNENPIKEELFLYIKKHGHQMIESFRNNLILEFESGLAQRCFTISKKFREMTISELRHLQSFDTTLFTSAICDTTRRTGRTTKKRSSSCSDEGYITNDNVSTGSQKSRISRSKTQRVTRTARSLSRNAGKDIPQAFKTPHNSVQPPNSYGVITPKCNPRTPQVLLRRPKLGEVAVSMQGSPLLTAPIQAEDRANVNIPLNDGSLLSLQPLKGLRISQIPAFEPDILRQLETLQENLIKVFEANQKFMK